jgi:muconolactone D-isomerase
MMEFLVRQSNKLPAPMTDEAADHRRSLQAAERNRATELRAAGILVKLWRVPGTRDAIGLYRAPDATALHDALSSLPMFPWLEISVEPLATHPQEQPPAA